MNKRAKLLPLIVAGLIALSGLALAACGDDDGEDRPGVEVIDDDDSETGSASGSVSGTDMGSGSVSGTVTGSGTGSGTGVGVEPGVVEDPPEGATQVNVTLREWTVEPETDSVEAGTIYFLVENAGPEDPHEFVIIRTDLDPAELPVEDGKVPEDEVDLLDEIEPFAPDSSASIAIDLEPGNYALICNIAEVEDGELESHYELGMHAAFTVE